MTRITATGPVIYVDETSGSDDSADGTTSKPYATALAAMIARGGDISILTRKSPEEEYGTVTPTLQKKLKKGLEIHDKKMKKLEENKEKLEKEAEEQKARDAKKLEESKAIKVEEDPTLPVAIKVK